jgi:hypothetical protein
MSRSNPTSFLQNPAKGWIKFAGSGEEGKGGYFSYYDKNEEKDVVIPLEELEFIALEWKLFCVSGFSKPLDAYCWSNEVRTVNDPIVIRNFKSDKTPAGEVLRGTYSQMKGDEGLLQQSKKTAQLKYVRSIYIMWKGDLWGLHVSGRTFSEWMETIEKKSSTKMMTHKIRPKSIEQGQNGDVEFTYATWEFTDEIPQDEGDAATEMDKKLQEYLVEYLKKNGSTVDQDKADTGGDDAAKSADRAPEKDPSDWRMFKMGDVELGKLNVFQIDEYLTACYEAGGRAEVKDPYYYDCLVAARREYDEAGKSALSKKDKEGKLLADYTEAELKAVSDGLIARRPHDPVRITVEAAWELKLKARREAEAKKTIEEDDDIPF